jgi:hypothetical protein
MKVLVYSNFSKKNWKKNEISKLHEEWKISGKIQKMGMLYTHFSKMPSPSPNFLIKPKIKIFKTKN